MGAGPKVHILQCPERGPDGPAVFSEGEFEAGAHQPDNASLVVLPSRSWNNRSTYPQ